MNNYIAFAALIAIAAAQGSSSAGNVTVVDGQTPARQPSNGDTAEASFALSEELNGYLTRDYLVALSGFLFVLLLYRVVLYVIRHTRTLACLNNDTQRYFVMPNVGWSNFKRHFLYAPLLRARHQRELQLSSAVSIGTLPTRFQSIFLIGIVAANVTLCIYGIPWHDPKAEVLRLLRNRTGSIAMANFVPIVVLSSPKNPLIKLLNISYDSMNIVHRNLARLAILEAIVHTMCYVIGTVETSSWSAVGESFIHSNLVMTGMIAVLTLLVVSIQATSALRHAFYELFLHLHIALVILALVFLSFHLAGLPARNLVIATVIAWVAMRLHRLATFIMCNLGYQGTKATVEILPGDALRVSVSAARKVQARPGSHLYLYIPSVGLWTSHPFSIVWSDTEPALNRKTPDSTHEEKLSAENIEVDLNRRQILSVVIRRRTGFTNSLYERAEKAGARDGVKLTLNAYVEAGYGVHQEVLSSCGTVMLFAAGVGITYQIPYVKHLVEGYALGTVATRKVVLVWVTQSPEHLEWIRPWMTQILAMEKRREVLLIKLYTTKPTNRKEMSSPSSTVQMFPGRPNIASMVKKASENQIGCMGVSVCGPGAFSNDVRAAVRQQKATDVEFVEEAFSW